MDNETSSIVSAGKCDLCGALSSLGRVKDAVLLSPRSVKHQRKAAMNTAISRNWFLLCEKCQEEVYLLHFLLSSR